MVQTFFLQKLQQQRQPITVMWFPQLCL